MPDASAITALLGPTNTGKTYRAIERMLEHESGMMGLPLRLLAREVYDKVSARVGEARVALITGEEQRVPRAPSYWIATVEAMPVAREVDFLVTDEVQLAAHEQRGHVFTSRILSARGRKETWFLGSETMRSVLRDLVPTARHESHPRLSRLGHAGAASLPRLPPRSAVVAFSMPHVYEIAERIRARKGGAAIVTGGLSPRTRNAQVAMFQAGEVDYLVATDAIGMGLNLDVSHVAFAALRKFDGREVREVDEPELGQIAGRAGRWIQDGTFGTLSPLELARGAVLAIENHRFTPLKRVRYRNDVLDFSSLSALRASLAQKPTRRALMPAHLADDALALDRLAEREAVRRTLSSPDNVRLLWDVCTVPDFRKLLFEVHVDFLEELYLALVTQGRLSDDWMGQHVYALGIDGGDVETLVARVAAMRIFTYVSNRAAWLASPERWQEETRAREDRLSDALHERLVMRFVDAKKGRVTKVARPRPTAAVKRLRESEIVQASSPKVAKDHPFAKLATMRGALQPASSTSLDEAAREDEADLERVLEAPHEDFTLQSSGTVVYQPTLAILGSLTRGTSVALPDARLDAGLESGPFALGKGAQSRLQRRLVAAARDFAGELVMEVRAVAAAHPSPPMRGFLHRLEGGLGTARRHEVEDVLAAMSDEERSALISAGVVLGARLVWLSSGLAPRAVEVRAALARAFFDGGGALRVPHGGAVSVATRRGVEETAYLATGHPAFGGRAIRADIADRAAEQYLAYLADAPSERVVPAELARSLASTLGCNAGELTRILAALVKEAPLEDP